MNFFWTKSLIYILYIFDKKSMNPFKALKQGEKYSKKDLSTLIEQPRV